MFIAELEHPDFATFDLTSLSKGVMAGSPCPIEIMRRVVRPDALPRNDHYLWADGKLARDHHVARRRPAGVACHHRGLRAAQYGSQDRFARTPAKPCLVGQIGELCTRGYLVMKGYDEDPEATAAAVDPRRLAAHRRPGAACTKTAISASAGAPRIPSSAAARISIRAKWRSSCIRIRKIADVYVVGLPDAHLGETVLAWIQLKPGETTTEEQIRDFCRGKIAYFKIPQYIRFVDSFPMTVTRKVQKFLMREQEIRERGLDRVANIETAWSSQDRHGDNQPGSGK